MITRADFRSAEGLATLIAGIALDDYFLLAMSLLLAIDAIAIRLSEAPSNDD